MIAFRNFFSIVRRYGPAFVLNVVGLCVALTVAALIVMQIRYDLTFDPDQPEKENICLATVDVSQSGLGHVAVTPRPLEDLILQNAGVAAVCRMTPLYQSVFVSTAGTAGERVSFKVLSDYVSESFTDVFSFDFVEGVPEPFSAPGSVIIPESIARKIAGESSALGMTLEINDGQDAYTVTGVYRDFAPNSSIHNALYLRLERRGDYMEWDSFNYTTVVRFSPEADRDAVAEAISEELLETGPDMTFLSGPVMFTDLGTLHFSDAAMFDPFPKADPSRLIVFLAIAVLVLVIASINLMNFNTALAPLRVRSINTMKVLGSSQGSLRAGIVCESAAVVVLAWFCSILLVLALKDTGIAGLIDPVISVSGQAPVFLITLCAALAAGILSGIYPAMYITSFPPALALKGNFALSPKGRRIRSLLVGFQFFVSFALAACIGVIFLQNRHLGKADLGFDKDLLMTVRIEDQFSADDYELFRGKVENIPGVERSSFASFILSSGDNIMTWGRDVNGDREMSINVVAVWDGFLETIGAEITEGRDFRKGDEDCWVFNGVAKRTYGMTLDDRVNSRDEIIGFVDDIHVASLRKAIYPMAFIYDPSWRQHDPYSDVAYIRIGEGSDLQQVKSAVTDILQDIVPDYPFEVITSDELFSQTYGPEKNTTVLVSSFCAIAVIISLIGVFCLVMFDSESRRKEIAVRKVMGAGTSGIVLNFIRSYMMILLVCFVLAVPVAVHFSGRWLDGFADRIAFPWWVLVLAFVAISAVTAATVAWQSFSAANENPIRNLKSE